MILPGLGGVGETDLLNAMRRAAEGEGILSVPIEAPEGQSLPTMLVSALRTAVLKLDRGQAAMTLAKRGRSSLARFVRVVNGDTLRAGPERIRLLGIDAPDDPTAGAVDPFPNPAQSAKKRSVAATARLRDALATLF
ncbi:hypothetical protein Q4F19_08620 [Sphingomonas sp. BIUV-7]|uniref:Uncharacterized protein n=1 Tax=Sphingomonas natans TaxID=3063330 RepID=A0ABT8Y806_9SPHN|nr:hypothetical protein [Sphingomonas sp. BIUV-7]MDO6414440.1 hypothetical protein [Sphingomonas sp. BIUV-7]